jgi:S1-C subfamily serine protease
MDFLAIPEPVVQAVDAVIAIHHQHGLKGSGFFFQPVNGTAPLILTNAHVMKGFQHREKTDETVHVHIAGANQPIKTRLPRISVDTRPTLRPAWAKWYDIAVLEPVEPLSLQPRILKFRDLKQHPLQKGEPIFVIGRAKGMEAKASIRPGEVADPEFRSFANAPFFIFGMDATMVKGTHLVFGGDSGGAVVDRNGQLVGILSKGGNTGDCYIIRGDDVMKVLSYFAVEPQNIEIKERVAVQAQL